MTETCGVDNMIRRKFEKNVICKNIGHEKMKRFLQFHWRSETCQMATTYIWKSNIQLYIWQSQKNIK